MSSWQILFSTNILFEFCFILNIYEIWVIAEINSTFSHYCSWVSFPLEILSYLLYLYTNIWCLTSCSFVILISKSLQNVNRFFVGLDPLSLPSPISGIIFYLIFQTIEIPPLHPSDQNPLWQIWEKLNRCAPNLQPFSYWTSRARLTEEQQRPCFRIELCFGEVL